MSPFKTIQNICSTIITVIFLYWFGTSAFKLGFLASNTPVLSPLVRVLIEKEKSNSEAENSLLERTLQFINSQKDN